MRHLIPLFLLSVFAIACKEKTPQEKAEAAVKDYLTKNLNDPKSYEPVSFGKIENDSTNYLSDKDFIRINDSMKVWDRMIKAIEKVSLEYDKTLDDMLQTQKDKHVYIDKSLKALDTLKLITISFKPQFIGYYIKHKYRAKNKMNATVLTDEGFFIDTLFNVTTK